MKLHHHAMVVGDMDRAIETYCASLGMRLLRRKPGVAFREVAMLEASSTGRCLELLLVEDCGPSRLDHVAFEVEDVDAAFRRLVEQGFTPEREPFDAGGGSVRTSFLTTPDGTKIELIRYGASLADPAQSSSKR